MDAEAGKYWTLFYRLGDLNPVLLRETVGTAA
jgi:hypothetical protein